jgi:hypothetical protein
MTARVTPTPIPIFDPEERSDDVSFEGGTPDIDGWVGEVCCADDVVSVLD